MPTTLGTSTSTGPLETTSFTLSPLNSVPRARVLRDHVALGDRVAVLLVVLSTVEARASSAAAVAASASLPVVGDLDRPGALADHEVDRGAALAARCPASGRRRARRPWRPSRSSGRSRRRRSGRPAASAACAASRLMPAQRGHLVPLRAARRGRGRPCRRGATFSPPRGVGADHRAGRDGLGVGAAADPERQARPPRPWPRRRAAVRLMTPGVVV